MYDGTKPPRLLRSAGRTQTHGRKTRSFGAGQLDFESLLRLVKLYLAVRRGPPVA